MGWRAWARPGRRRWTLLVTALVALIALGVGIGLASTGESTYVSFGVSDPGWVVRFGTPLLRFLSYACASLCLGDLALAAFFTTPGESGLVSPTAYAALRGATRAAMGWAAAAGLLVFFDSAATAGLPLHRVLSPAAMVTLVAALEPTKAWLSTLVLVVVVVIGCARTVHWRSTVLLLALAVVATLPPSAVAGHPGSGIGHDLTTGAAVLHVPAALLWLGTLVALARARALGAGAAVAWRRYRWMSLWCAVVVFASGLVLAAILTDGPAGSAGAYTAIVVAKVALFAAVVAVLVVARRRVVTTAPTRLVAVELGLLVLSLGAAVALAQLPTPNARWRLSVAELLIGYDLTRAPTVAGLLLAWRFDVLLGTVAVALAAGYLAGWWRLRRVGAAWPTHRLVCWLAGCAVWLSASSSGVGRYALAMVSLQLAQHVVVGMVVPVLLVLGAPLTLAGRAWPGLEPWLAALRTSATLRRLTHPLVATLVFAATPFVMYFTPLLDVTVRYHWAHLPVELATLGVGYLFAWLIVGADPLPAPVPHLLRLGALLGSMPVCGVFAALVIDSHHVLGDSTRSGNFYTALDLPWTNGPLADQHLGGLLALGIGEAALWALLALLLVGWSRDSATGMPDYDRMVASLRDGARTLVDAETEP